MDIQFERPKERGRSDKLSNFFTKIIHLTVYAMFFLVPLFFLPFTVDFFDYNKQYLLWALTFLGVIFWIIKMAIIEKRIVWKRTPLDIPIFIFLGANFLAMFFSIDRYISIWGNYGTFQESFINIFVMCTLFFLITNNF